MNNDPAFPVYYTNKYEVIPGLTKREWFAGMALMGLCSRESTGSQLQDNSAQLAFMYADAMIEESQKPTT